MLGHQFVVKNSRVWHPNTQMSEWSGFDKITNAKDVFVHGKRTFQSSKQIFKID